MRNMVVEEAEEVVKTIVKAVASLFGFIVN